MAKFSRRKRSVLMKILVLFLIFIAFTSCSHLGTPFVERNIRIVPPVKQQFSKNGDIVMGLYSDGGTKKFVITDAEGKKFDVYIDHRINKKKEWGTFYLNGHPNSANSIRIIDQRGFKEKIMKDICIGETEKY